MTQERVIIGRRTMRATKHQQNHVFAPVFLLRRIEKVMDEFFRT